MAIYHLSCKNIQRAKGQSSVGSIAYRSCTKMIDERTGEVHDYTHKKGLEHSEILTPENIPDKLKNRETLWNEVEKTEKRKDSRLAKEIEIGLPKELNRQEQIKLTREFVKENFVKHGMIADINIHNTGNGNPHAHIMLTTRGVDENGFLKIKNRDWNNKELLCAWRENWAKVTNQYLKLNNINQTIDHRSYEKQGLEKIPTIHLGATAHKLEQKGIETDRGNINRNIIKYNQEIELEKNRNLKMERANNQINSYKNNMLEAKNTFTNCESLKIDNNKKLIELNTQIQGLKNNLELYKNYENTLIKYNSQLKDLQEQKENIKGFFKGKERKEIDNSISNLQLKTNQTLKYYEDKGIKKINVNEINKGLKELEQQKIKIIDYQDQIKNVQSKAEFDYKLNKCILGSLDIKTKVGATDPKNIKNYDTLSVLEVSQINKNIEKLDILNKQDIEKIKNKLPEAIQEKLENYIEKNHKLELEQKKVQTIKLR